MVPLVALLPVLGALSSVLAAPSAHSGTLTGRDTPLKHKDMGKHAAHGRRMVKRACKAKTSAVSMTSSAAAIAATSSGYQVSVTTSSADNAASDSIILAPAASSLVGYASAVTSAVASTTSSSLSAAAAASSGSSSSGGATVNDKAALTPNGIKAGMTLCTGIDEFSGKLGWCYDWSPIPSAPSGMAAVSMLWGDGHLGDEQDDASRVSAFKALTTSPEYIIGFEEPDCSTTGSAAISVEESASTWNELIAPHGVRGSLLISPSMCHQADETFLTPFKALITTDWDVTNLHINKKDMAGVQDDLDHYWNTYGKPMWVTEFACVEDQSWTPCTDQAEINQFISDIVKLFEEDARVYAYAYSNGVGLGDVWPAISNGQLTASGQAYLNAVSEYH